MDRSDCLGLISQALLYGKRPPEGFALISASRSRPSHLGCAHQAFRIRRAWAPGSRPPAGRSRPRAGRLVPEAAPFPPPAPAPWRPPRASTGSRYLCLQRGRRTDASPSWAGTAYTTAVAACTLGPAVSHPAAIAAPPAVGSAPGYAPSRWLHSLHFLPVQIALRRQARHVPQTGCPKTTSACYLKASVGQKARLGWVLSSELSLQRAVRRKSSWRRPVERPLSLRRVSVAPPGGCAVQRRLLPVAGLSALVPMDPAEPFAIEGHLGCFPGFG
nr:uncharacterized protein LOC103237561 [Chlorocebus sabaeus]